MSAFLALAPNPIDTRAFATRALATAPESAGINDMQGKATPGLGALGRGIAAAGQNAAAAKEKAEEDAAYAEHDAEEAQLRRSAEDRRKREAAEAARAANNYWEKPETLAGHYADHGEGVGTTSKEEYTRMIHEFYLNRAQHLVKVSDKGVKIPSCRKLVFPKLASILSCCLFHSSLCMAARWGGTLLDRAPLPPSPGGWKVG